MLWELFPSIFPAVQNRFSKAKWPKQNARLGAQNACWVNLQEKTADLITCTCTGCSALMYATAFALLFSVYSRVFKSLNSRK